MEHSRAVKADQLSIRQYMDVLWKNRWIILPMVIIAAATAFFYTKQQTPEYHSSASVLVLPVELTPEAAQAGDLNIATEMQLAQSKKVLRMAAESLPDPVRPAEIASGLEVSNEPDTEILVFEYTGRSASEAKRHAQAVADSYLEMRRQQAIDGLVSASESLRDQLADARSRLRRVQEKILVAAEDPAKIGLLQPKVDSFTGEISILRQELASMNSTNSLSGGRLIEPAGQGEASIPSPMLNGFIAVLVGLLLGSGIAFFRDHLDERIDDPEDLEFLTRAPTLAAIPTIPVWRRRGNAYSIPAATPGSPAGEPFGILRASLLFAASRRGFKTLMITSAGQGEGKTSTTANIAWAIARAGKNVTVVSADMRKPRLHQFFRAPESPGLSDVVRGRLSLEEAVCRPPAAPRNLLFLSAGSSVSHSAELLGSPATGKVLEQLAESSDLVLIDCAPLLPVADALAMVPYVDAVLLVADAQKTTHPALARARQWLDQLEAPVIGTVLNNFQPKSSLGYGHARNYHRSDTALSENGHSDAAIAGEVNRTTPERS